MTGVRQKQLNLNIKFFFINSHSEFYSLKKLIFDGGEFNSDISFRIKTLQLFRGFSEMSKDLNLKFFAMF